MKIHALATALLLLFGTTISEAKTLMASGIADCKNRSEADCKAAAQRDAQASLANQLFVQVESVSKSEQTNQGKDVFQWASRTYSNVPLLGAQTQCVHISSARQYSCEAVLETQAVSSQYQRLLNEISQDVKRRHQALSQDLSAHQYDELNQLLNELQKFQRLSLVLGLISPEVEQPQLQLTSAELQKQILKIQQQPGSLDELALLAAKEVGQDKIYIRPVLMIGSKEVTPFSAALYQRLQSQIEGKQKVTEPSQADHFLSGSYQPLEKGMDLSLSLTNRQGDSLMTRVWQLKPELYQAYRTEPQLLDFEQLLHQGYVVTDDFQVELQTNKGNRGVIFAEGETARILVKMNRSGYFYVAGHIKNDQEQLSYLLPISDEPGEYAFERYVGPEHTNKWLDISGGGFEIQPPLGMESLQVFASTDSFVKSKRLPQGQQQGPYYVLARDSKKVVQLTRGLVRKKPKKSTKTSEAVLMLTTVAASQL